MDQRTRTSEIQEFMRQLLAAEYFDEALGYSTWTTSPGASCTRCTDSALLIAARFGGAVYDYPIERNESPTTIGLLVPRP